MPWIGIWPIGVNPTVLATSAEIIVTSAPVSTSARNTGAFWRTGAFGRGGTFAAVAASMIPTSRNICERLWMPQMHGMRIVPQISPSIGHLLDAENPVVEQLVTGLDGVH